MYAEDFLLPFPYQSLSLLQLSYSPHPLPFSFSHPLPISLFLVLFPLLLVFYNSLSVSLKMLQSLYISSHSFHLPFFRLILLNSLIPDCSNIMSLRVLYFNFEVCIYSLSSHITRSEASNNNAKKKSTKNCHDNNNHHHHLSVRLINK